MIGLARSAAAFRERVADHDLPYTTHLSEHVVSMANGRLLTMFEVEGADFESKDLTAINGLHNRFSGWLKDVNDHRLALWISVVRRRGDGLSAVSLSSDWAKRFDRAYQERLRAEELLISEIFVSLVWGGEGIPNWLRARKGQSEAVDGTLEDFEEKALSAERALERYGCRRLGLREEPNGVRFSEPMEALHRVLTAKKCKIPLVDGPLGGAVCAWRTIFGREAFEIRDVDSSRYGKILGLKEYPGETWPGMLNPLLSTRYEWSMTQSFRFMPKGRGIEALSFRRNRMIAAMDHAESQVTDLVAARDQVLSGEYVIGDHHFSLSVFADDFDVLNRCTADARNTLSDCGAVTALEDFGNLAGWFAQAPGNTGFRVRPAKVKSRNFAALASMHNYPTGRAEGNWWGPSIAVLKSRSGSAYHFNLHVGEVGHCFICGPTESGKTVLIGFVLAQMEKFGARRVVFDKDRGCEILVRACGGQYLALRNGTPTGCAPFKAMELTAHNVVFLRTLVEAMVNPARERLTARDKQRIETAIDGLAELPPAKRSVTAVKNLLGFGKGDDDIGRRLERWCQGNALGWVFDADTDDIDLEADFLGFDVTDFLDNEEIRAPVMMYLFERVEQLVDGRPMAIVIDEFWKAALDPVFARMVEDRLKTARKSNIAIVLATQSPADAAKSLLAVAIKDLCLTKIYFGNDAAERKDYSDVFNLSDRELELVRDELSGKGEFLVRHGRHSLVAVLDLTGMDAELAVLSGRRGTVDLVSRLIETHGEDPAKWLPAFEAEWRGVDRERGIR